MELCNCSISQPRPRDTGKYAPQGGRNLQPKEILMETASLLLAESLQRRNQARSSEFGDIVASVGNSSPVNR